MSNWYSDYRFYIIWIILLIIVLFIYLFVRESDRLNYINSLFKADWVANTIIIIFIYIVIFSVLSFIIYYVNFEYVSNNRNAINTIVFIYIFTLLAMVISMHGIRNISMAFLLSIISLLISIGLAYAGYYSNKSTKLILLLAGIVVIFNLYFFLSMYNLYSRNVLCKLPYNTATTSELLHYNKLREKKCIDCKPYTVYKEYCPDFKFYY